MGHSGPDRRCPTARRSVFLFSSPRPSASNFPIQEFPNSFRQLACGHPERADLGKTFLEGFKIGIGSDKILARPPRSVIADKAQREFSEFLRLGQSLHIKNDGEPANRNKCINAGV